jgi:hypothetical protein
LLLTGTSKVDPICQKPSKESDTVLEVAVDILLKRLRILKQ